MAERKPSDDKAAFGIYPKAGKRSEDKQDREAAKNIPVDLARGLIAGAVGMPGDIESLIRMLPGLNEKTVLPTSEDVLKRIPLGSDSPTGRFASGLGILAGGSAPVGPAIQGVKALPGALQTVARNVSAPRTLDPQAGAIVYHGSPHKFDKFDASKIGTGEGAQAYGHGLYFAEDRGIADVYRKKLTGIDGAPVGNPNESLQVAIGRLQSEINKLRQSDDPSAPAMIRAYEGRIKELDNAGTLYTVDLPDEKIARMLDWDKPLSDQPEVINALRGTDYEVGMSQREAEKLADTLIRQEADDWAEMTGGDPIDYSNNVDWEKYVDQIRKDSGRIDSGITGKDLHRMIMRDEGYRPELFDPENYQVGTSEVLRGYDIPGIKYLDATSRDVGEGTRNFVVFPGEEDALSIVDRKARGGVVVSNNPDTMMLEVNNKRMQAGGLAKLLRAAPKSKAEIEAIAERMAPQMLGEFVRGDKGTQSVAGKTQKQFAKEKDMTVDVRPTKGQGKAPKAVSIEELKDQVMIGIPGDPTIANKTLYGINDMRLDSPSPQHGGPLYGLEHEGDAFWASGLGAANRVQNLAREAGQQYDMPVLGNYIMMGPESINYAQHFADANLSAINPAKMSRAQIEAFNNLVREGYPYVKNKERFQRVFPAFPGIENPSEAYLHFAIDPELRKHFNALMQMPTVTEKFNLPSGIDVRFAITEPDLRDLETGVTGKSIGRMRPEVEDLSLSSHPTYSHDIPGEFLGSSNYPMPYDLSFPDTVKAIRENPKQAPHEFGSLKMVGPRQVIDQQMIDEIRQYEEMLKKMTGMAAGGVVNSLAKTEALAKLAKLREEMATRSEAVKNLTAKDENKYLSDVTPNSLTKAEIEAEIARMKARVQPEVKKADGGAIDFNTTPDTSDKGRIMEGAPFKHGGKVKMTANRDAMFLELSNKKLKRK